MISSHSFTLMINFFLQKLTTKVIPCLPEVILETNNNNICLNIENSGSFDYILFEKKIEEYVKLFSFLREEMLKLISIYLIKG
jgi:hypothetical protein